MDLKGSLFQMGKVRAPLMLAEKSWVEGLAGDTRERQTDAGSA